MRRNLNQFPQFFKKKSKVRNTNISGTMGIVTDYFV